MRTFRWLPVTCMHKGRKTSAPLWPGIDERKYPENIPEILMVKFKWFCLGYF